jgi:N-acetylgalactosamine-6-sulfatase
MSSWKTFQVAALAAVFWCGAAAGAPPNIVFIFADDLGWGDLGAYGNARIKTPHLDRMAAEGTLFSQFYVNSGVCSPSRTAVMTGQFPARHRIHGHLATHERNRQRDMPNWLDPTVPMLPRILEEAGYATAHFGKWHLGRGPGAPDPGAYGIDSHRTINTNGPGWEDQNAAYFRAKSTRLFVDEAIDFIRENRNQPFYVNVWTLIPHATLSPTEEQMAPYIRFGPRGVRHVGTSPIYFGTVSDLDEQVGRLIAAVDELGLKENTLILFSSDNGPEEIHIANANHSGVGSPGPLRGRKRSIYEGGVRVPFIARWPGRVEAGRVDTESVVTAVDLLPTLVSLAGARIPDGHELDGEDRGQVLLGKPAPRTKPILWEWRFRVFGHVFNMSPMLAVRDGRWKLLMNPDRSRMELYDIPNDPREMNNIARQQPDVVSRLSKVLLNWQRSLPDGMTDEEAGRADYPMPPAR